MGIIIVTVILAWYNIYLLCNNEYGKMKAENALFKKDMEELEKKNSIFKETLNSIYTDISSSEVEYEKIDAKEHYSIRYFLKSQSRKILKLKELYVL